MVKNNFSSRKYDNSLFYKGWDVYQQRLVAAIAPLTAEQLALRSSPHNWSVGMIATHIVAARVWWFHTKMDEGSAELAAFELWDFGICEEGEDPLHSAAELVDGLERSSIQGQTASFVCP